MPWPMNTANPLCDVCGRFISFRDIEAGKALHQMITPDSDISREEFRSYCPTHYTLPCQNSCQSRLNDN